MVAFAEGLAIDPKSAPLLSGVTQTMLLSPLKGTYINCLCCVILDVCVSMGECRAMEHSIVYIVLPGMVKDRYLYTYIILYYTIIY